MINETASVAMEVRDLSIPLERDVFLRTLIRELSGTLQDVVGLEEASGFVSVVGQRVGDQINESYKNALQVAGLDRPQVAAVLVDLKRRIEGDFYVIEETEEKIVLGNRACPFGDKVLGRPAMCDDFERVRRDSRREPRVLQGRAEGNHRPGTCRLPGRGIPKSY
jgi:hypothetical protein